MMPVQTLIRNDVRLRDPERPDEDALINDVSITVSAQSSCWAARVITKYFGASESSPCHAQRDDVAA